MGADPRVPRAQAPSPRYVAVLTSHIHDWVNLSCHFRLRILLVILRCDEWRIQSKAQNRHRASLILSSVQIAKEMILSFGRVP